MPTSSHPENAVQTATDSATTGMLSDLSITLAELQPLAPKISVLQKQTLEKEASILKAILEKLTPLVPLLSKDYEQYYRREIVILTRDVRVQLEDGLGFFSEHSLILYENGLLVRIHRYGQSIDHGQLSEAPQLGWENTDEDVLTPEAAIIAFGFTAISEGLIKALGEASSMAIFEEELESRLASLAEALKALR
ncbi:MAG: hypothetical protein WB392_00795 [Methanotrichaceae archaeon]